MPLLKRQTAAPAIKDAIVLDLGDVSRQAQRLREQAEAHAQRVLADAEARAQQLIEGAEATGHERGYAAGYEKGLAEGREQGRAEALEQATERLRQLEASWTQTLEQWHERRHQLELEARQGVVELALRIAHKLVHRTVEVDPTVIADQLAAALAHVLRPLDVAVRIHPDDRPVLDEALPALVKAMSSVQSVELIDDNAISRGGCILSFGHGQVDASLESQFDRIAHALLPDATGNQGPEAGDQASHARPERSEGRDVPPATD